ncbi:MAG: 4-hydroxy-tetrahydrodipicolinate synthase [Salibacteraceae bacterium]
MSSAFSGTGVAIVTPFTANGNIDYQGLERLVEHLIANGIDYLVVQGTTGESPVLSSQEKREVLDFVIEVNKGRLPVVLGHGGNHTAGIVAGFEQFDFCKVDGILSVSPAYNKPTQEGIYQHFKAVVNASPVPVILYNVPGRTSSNMSADTTLRLSHDFEKVVAIKEASGNLDQIGKIIRERPDNFLVISGDDALIVPHLSIGGDGIISVIANALPAEFGGVVAAGLKGDFATARLGFHALAELIPMLFAEGNPGGVKAALQHLGICEAHVRLPLVPISEALRGRITEFIDQLGEDDD